MTNEALLLVLTLTRTLSRPKLRESIVVVADQLRKLGGMLRDIGMSKEVLEAVSERRLEIATTTAEEFGDEEWVLHDLWQCAADHVWELDIYAEEREAAATKAEKAARQLIFISSKHSDFYYACSLHYDAITSDTYFGNKGAYDQITQAVNLLRDAASSTSSSEHLEEMMRAMRSQFMSNHYSSEDMKAIYVQTLLNPSDPTWAILCAEIGKDIFDPDQLDDDSLEMVVCLETHAIKVLRSCQHARTRIQRLLGHALAARGWCLFEMDRRSEAIPDFEEAIYIQARVAKFGQEPDDLFNLRSSVMDCLRHQLERAEEDALGTLKRWVEIAESHSRMRSEILSTGVLVFRSHLEDSRDTAALSAACALVDSLRPLLRSNHSNRVIYESIDTLVTISDIHREFGEFKAALDTSREALAVARELRSQSSKYTYFEALACHARSLVDDDAYDDATALLEEAISITSSDNTAYKRRLLGNFGVVHAHAAISGRPSCIDEAISASCSIFNNCARPFCLTGRMILVNEHDKCAWLRFIRSVMECTTSPTKAQASAKESLTLMSQYYERHRAGMKAYARASVSGNQYILLSILGDLEQGQWVLNESITLFRRVLQDDPRMARLPLILFLDILLVLFRPLPLRFEATTLQRWKKSVYEGSMGFFDDFVIFLESLPYYTHVKS